LYALYGGPGISKYKFLIKKYKKIVKKFSVIKYLLFLVESLDPDPYPHLDPQGPKMLNPDPQLQGRHEPAPDLG
jgi:hypothetical protein